MMAKHLAKIIGRIFRPRVRDPKLTETAKDSFVPKLSWLQDLENKAVKDYIRRENTHANVQLFHSRRFQKKIQKDIKILISLLAEDSSELYLEEKIGSFVYYEKECNGGVPNIYRKCLMSGQETIVLDQNKLAKKTGYVQTGPLKVSPSGNLLAVVVNLDGKNTGSCLFYTFGSESSFTAEIPMVSNAEWCSDDNDIILATFNEFGVTDEIKRYNFETTNTDSLFKEKDARFRIDLMKSRDNQYIILHSNSKICSEVHVLNANNVSENFKMIVKREAGIECYVDHWKGYFYALRNCKKTGEYVISRLPSHNTTNDWEDIYCTKDSHVILDIEIFSDNLLVYELNKLIPQLTIIPFDVTKPKKTIKVSFLPSIIESFSNQDPYTDIARFSLTSPIQPYTVYELDMKINYTKNVSKFGHWDSTKFKHHLLEAISEDGTSIPVSLFFEKEIKNLSNAPMLTTAYGSYGELANLRFSEENAFLLNDGWILAFPHVRGGGEFGRKWYKSATKLGKKRTFEDLEASLLQLHKSGFSNPSKTAVLGMSAGGLAAAFLCNKAPTLLKAAILKVPFVDILTATMNENDDAIFENDEWGNPRDSKDDFLNISSYCPVENLQFHKRFPSVYLKSHLDDKIVPAWMPLKWTWKWRYLEELNKFNFQQQNIVVCRIYETGGHFGTVRQNLQKQTSELIAFLYTALNLKM